MVVDSSSSTELPAEKTRDQKSLAPDTTPNDSQPETEVGDGAEKLTDDVEPPAPEAKRSVTGLKVCGAFLGNLKIDRGMHSGSWG
jgi:hypothetical protein